MSSARKENGRRLRRQPTAAVGESEIVFGDGLIGFPAWRRFALRPGPPSSPLRRLECLDEPSVCLTVVDPLCLDPGYRVAASKEDLLSLELEDPAQALVLCTLTVRGEPPAVTANLLGPLLINPRSRLGRQLVLADSGYSVRHPIAALAGGSAPREGA